MNKRPVDPQMTAKTAKNIVASIAATKRPMDPKLAAFLDRHFPIKAQAS